MHPSLIDSCFSVLVVEIVVCLLSDDGLDQMTQNFKIANDQRELLGEGKVQVKP